MALPSLHSRVVAAEFDLHADVGLSWPAGEAVFTGLTTTFGEGRSGLIGVNGAGKSTLLKIVAGSCV